MTGLFLITGFLGSAETHASQRHVLMVVNEGFWAPEYYEPRATFDREGYRVTVAGEYSGLVRPDRRNVNDKPVKADITYSQIDLSKFDAITFAGGNGAWTAYFPNDQIHKVLKDAFDRKMLIGLLCSSTGLLGVAGNFDGQSTPLAVGRHVTGYYRVRGLMTTLGKVNYDAGEAGKPFGVVDGNLITGRDPISATAFGEAIAKEIKTLKN